jgi:hypothetical protein
MPRRNRPPRRPGRAPRTARGEAPLTVERALDDVRFGPQRTLNLRNGLPSAADAVYRAEAWLRQQQVARARDSVEVLVITGRGRGSLDGIPVVREAVVRLFGTLRRTGVIEDVREHTAGSFVVRLASVRTLLEAPRRRHHMVRRPVRDPAALAALDVTSRRLLRNLAHASLAALGVRDPGGPSVADEMVRQFSHIAGGVADGPGREGALHAAIAAAIEEYEVA